MNSSVFRSSFIFILGFVVIIVCVGIFFVRAFTVEADVSRFYPSSCLGGWRYPNQAAGVPEVVDMEVAFDTESSAILESDTSAQIFCGDFVGDIPDKKALTGIRLQFLWQETYSTNEVFLDGGEDSDVLLDETQISNSETGIETEEMIESESVEEMPESHPAPQEETSEEIQMEDTTVSDDKPVEDVFESSNEPLSFLSWFPVAHAQESETIVTASGEEMTETGEEVTKPTDATGDYGVVEVLYTLDGVEWRSLGFVDHDEFDSTSFEIPITEIGNWEGISHVQISIRAVPVTDDVTSTIYLDSLWLEAEYEKEGVLTAIVPNDAPIFEADDIAEFFDPGELPSVSVKTWDDVIIDSSASHHCIVDSVAIDISDIPSASASVMLESTDSGSYDLEIGALPDHIDVAFDTGSTHYQVKDTEQSIQLSIYRSPESQQGDFSIPIVYTKHMRERDSSVICQLNLTNAQ